MNILKIKSNKHFIVKIYSFLVLFFRIKPKCRGECNHRYKRHKEGSVIIGTEDIKIRSPQSIRPCVKDI